jgi:bacteriorhodopsin
MNILVAIVYGVVAFVIALVVMTILATVLPVVEQFSYPVAVVVGLLVFVSYLTGGFPQFRR